MDYARYDILGDLEEGRSLEAYDVQRRINELKQLKEATKQALEEITNSSLFQWLIKSVSFVTFLYSFVLVIAICAGRKSAQNELCVCDRSSGFYNVLFQIWI